MNGERWQRVEELYHTAVEHPPHERAAFLKRVCPDADLRREVESLLGSEPAGDSVLDQPAWERRLAAGERLGPYEILQQIGAGGMGEVWKARDTRLGRMVAIKVCAERFSARFEREARAIAALNHPHICTLHDVGPNYLVMEYLVGQPLKGPLPVARAIEYSREILDGLKAAHRNGIVHRDLKPANVLVTSSGVKLLDFGLAKLQPKSEIDEPGEIGATGVTDEHAIVGTPQYMAPEQIEGKPVDGRTDIFAFGCLLYELLVGKPAFEGKSAASTMAAILAAEPAPLSRLRPSIPVELDRIVNGCLAKDPQERFQTVRDIRRALDWALEAKPAATRVRSVATWAVAGALSIVGAVALAGWWRAARPVERPLVRFSVDLGLEAVAGIGNSVAISPDGRRLAFPVRGTDGKQRLATRALDESQVTVLPGTENGRHPFFSPDSQWVGFVAAAILKKISVQGGAPVALCNSDRFLGASWGEDGNVAIALSQVSPLFRVPASGGGTRQVLTKLSKDDVSHRWPQVLPGGQAVLFTASPSAVGMEYANIEVVSMKTGATKILQREGYFGRYVPSGHLVYIHQGALFGIGFDAERLEVRGSPTPLLEDVASDPMTGDGQFDFSGMPSGPGALVYLAGKSPAPGWPIVWLDSTGKTKTLLAKPAVYSQPRLSPDGRRLAVTVASKGNDIFVYDWQRDAMTRLTFDGHSTVPVWSPDGNHIVFKSTAGGAGISWLRSDGAGEPQRLLQSPDNVAERRIDHLYPMSFSPDGRRLAYHSAYAGPGDDLWTLPLDTTDPDHPKPGQPELFLQAPYDSQFPAFSPDGRWIAYRSSESGQWQIYVRPFPGPGGKWQISPEGGTLAWWSKKGRQLFFRSPNGWLLVVDYTVKGNSFVPGKPRPWSDRQVNTGYLNLDLAPDGKRFVVFPVPEAAGPENSSVHVTFLLNFFDELRRRVPAGSK